MSEFAKKGYDVSNDVNADADVYIINTCTVTNQSDQKSKRVMNRTNRLHSKALKIVTGCMATNYKDELIKSGKADLIVDNNHKTSIVDIVESYFNGEIVNPDDFESDVFDYDSAEVTAHTRAMIKIQDGCNNFCTFCIIPKVRGRAVSRPLPDIIKNIKQVIDYGYKEIVLTGVNLGRYNFNGVDFEGLVNKIINIPGNFRLRISSIEPDGFTESFFKLFKHKKLTPHLHLCLQSGSEEILKKMRRMYSGVLFEEMTKKLRVEIENFNITTDIIVGFPGETEKDFKETLEMSERIGFGHIHTFKYSVRKGTRAEKLPDHIPENIKMIRSELIRTLSEKMRQHYRKSFIGKTQIVLIERYTDKGYATGYGENYVPVIIKKQNLEKNIFYKVRLTNLCRHTDEPFLEGVIVESNVSYDL
jgi:threonylcarbamoyladenosine tRNA methylthiotransferase MtaB